MAEEIIELGLEGADFVTEKYHDRIYDKLPARISGNHRSSSADFAQDSDSGSSDDGRARVQRSRGGTNDDLGERQYQTPRSTINEDTRRRSSNEPNHGSQAGYGARDLELSHNQTLIQPLYQTSSYRPYTPSDAAMTYLSRPSTASSRTTPNRRRYYSQSPSPPPPRHRDRAPSGTDVDMTSGVIGALAGGLVGSQVGQGGTLATVVAAAIGAVGANQLEKRYDKHRKRERRKERRAERS